MSGVQVVPAPFVAQQLQTLVADVQVDAIKIGMLATTEIVAAVIGFLDGHPCEIVVLDPVMVATSGDRLLSDGAVQAMRELLPRASVITPNLAEAAVLLDCPVAATVADMHDQADALLALGPARVLLKGGHLGREHAPSPAETVDVFVGPEGTHELHGPRVQTSNTHGTGCSLSSALAALRPQRQDWLITARDSKAWLTAALEAADSLRVGHGHGPVHHFHAIWKTT